MTKRGNREEGRQGRMQEVSSIKAHSGVGGKRENGQTKNQSEQIKNQYKMVN
jgi:hypothetical protein